MLKQNPCATDLLTSWSGRLSKPTCPVRLRFLGPLLTGGRPAGTGAYVQQNIQVQLVNHVKLNWL